MASMHARLCIVPLIDPAHDQAWMYVYDIPYPGMQYHELRSLPEPASSVSAGVPWFF